MTSMKYDDACALVETKEMGQGVIAKCDLKVGQIIVMPDDFVECKINDLDMNSEAFNTLDPKLIKKIMESYTNKHENCKLIFDSVSVKKLVITTEIKAGEPLSRHYGEEYWKCIFPSRWLFDMKTTSTEENMRRLDVMKEWRHISFNNVWYRSLYFYNKKQQISNNNSTSYRITSTYLK